MRAESPTGARAGFTLIEVICALAVMMFLFGGIYGIANGAMVLCRSSNDAGPPSYGSTTWMPCCGTPLKSCPVSLPLN